MTSGRNKSPRCVYGCFLLPVTSLTKTVVVMMFTLISASAELHRKLSQTRLTERNRTSCLLTYLINSQKSIQNKPSSARWAHRSFFRCGGQLGQSSAQDPVQENRPHGFLSCSNLRHAAEVLADEPQSHSEPECSPVTLHISHIEHRVGVSRT